ncbi:hypothetical protein OIU79_008551 [Salix purpurea]|uniref:Uncharacterized protein n=1 Tax=Salix purpurea TaxID=77065 RepID=A0A9Q0TIP8_SALPP|nr:hypothetical protein OIU79_008551 [Salix purpurea]
MPKASLGRSCSFYKVKAIRWGRSMDFPSFFPHFAKG